MTEIERKFLIRSIPFPLDDYPVKNIRQGYLPESIDGDEVRVRQKGTRYFLTAKKGSGLERQESESEINQQQFEILYSVTGDQRLEKNRFEIQYSTWLIELDIFTGKLDGLILAEVEFVSVEDSKSFKAPEWFDREVTEEMRFKNRNLARHGIPLNCF
jgi:adenylate cyclase